MARAFLQNAAGSGSSAQAIKPLFYTHPKKTTKPRNIVQPWLALAQRLLRQQHKLRIKFTAVGKTAFRLSTAMSALENKVAAVQVHTNQPVLF